MRQQQGINTVPGRSLQEVRNGQHVYHFEYTNIHNQRIALVRLIHLWHQIGFPASYVIYGFFFGYAVSKETIWLVFVGAALSTFVIYFIRKYSLTLDQSVTMLYPRIIALELILDYHFYRNYLRHKGPEEKEYVEKCEGIQAENTEQIWEKVSDFFTPESFPSHRRGHGILNKAAWFIVVSFWVITVVAALFLILNPTLPSDVSGA